MADPKPTVVLKHPDLPDQHITVPASAMSFYMNSGWESADGMTKAPESEDEGDKKAETEADAEDEKAKDAPATKRATTRKES